MSSFGTLLENLWRSEVVLETYDRAGRLARKLDGRALVEAIREERRRVREILPAPDGGGRRLIGLLFRSEETVEFVVATVAVVAEGGTVVPLYPNWSEEQQRFYLRSYGVRVLITGEGFHARAEGWRGDLDHLHLLTLAGWAERRIEGEPPRSEDLFPFDLPPDHPAAWIFTSGTSSEIAKCTEITLGNLEAAIENIRALDFIWEGMRVHSPLSASHVFAFVVIFGFLALKPRRVVFSDVQYLARLDEDRIGRVDALILVPIVLNRLRKTFYERLLMTGDASSAPPELRRLLRFPLGVRRFLKRLTLFAEEIVLRAEQGRRPWLLLYPLVWLVRALCGRLVRKRLASPRFVVVGGAKPDLRAMAFLEVMGVRCLQGWGMTETTGPLAVCHLRDRFAGAFGTCGRLFAGTIARIEGEELVVEGPQIARGYVEPGGRLTPFGGVKRTGDRAEFDGRGRLRILGKVSDRITTENGLNYNPIPMEEEIKARDVARENLLDEAVVIGDGKPRLGCVFFLREGVEPGSRVKAYLESLVRDFNRSRPVDERIGPWTISPVPLRESGALGPSGKLVRRRVEERFQSIYEEPVAV